VLSVDVHVVNDLREPLGDAVLVARLLWAGGGRAWRFAGEVPAGRSTFVGRLMARLPEVAILEAATAGGPSPRGGPWPVELELQLRCAGLPEPAANHYRTSIKV
jgi:hypothetical protein